jgi:hypothetical protein
MKLADGLTYAAVAALATRTPSGRIRTYAVRIGDSVWPVKEAVRAAVGQRLDGFSTGDATAALRSLGFEIVRVEAKRSGEAKTKEEAVGEKEPREVQKPEKLRGHLFEEHDICGFGDHPLRAGDGHYHSTRTTVICCACTQARGYTCEDGIARREVR